MVGCFVSLLVRPLYIDKLTIFHTPGTPGSDGTQPRLRPLVHGDDRQGRSSDGWIRAQWIEDLDLERAGGGSVSGLGEMRLGQQDPRVLGGVCEWSARIFHMPKLCFDHPVLSLGNARPRDARYQEQAGPPSFFDGVHLYGQREDP